MKNTDADYMSRYPFDKIKDEMEPIDKDTIKAICHSIYPSAYIETLLCHSIDIVAIWFFHTRFTHEHVSVILSECRLHNVVG